MRVLMARIFDVWAEAREGVQAEAREKDRMDMRP